MRSGPTSPFIDPPDTASYDALTDLFLGESPSSPGPLPVTPESAGVAPRRDHSVRPNGAEERSRGWSESSSVTPGNLPLTEKPQRDDTLLSTAPQLHGIAPVLSANEQSPSSPYPLRLTPLRSPSAAYIEFESIVLGHLPIRANPWAAQYARAAADRANEPIGLLRLLAGEIWIDLFGVPPAQRERHARDTFTEALDHAARTARRWIVQCDEGEGLDTLPLDKCAAVTLLCAGNEAAVLAAFQSLKALAAAAPRAASLRVAVMGASEQDAASITARLRQSADLFLKRKVDAAPSVSKMGPTGGAPVFRAGTAHPPAAIIERLRAAREAAATEPAPVAPAQPQAAQTVALQRTPTPAPAVPAAHPRSTLTSRLPSLTPLPFVCPEDSGTELARDAAGTLHLLRAGDTSDALRALTACHAWAVKNAALLAMVSPGLTVEGAAQHLFTADPKFTRPLLDSRLRVHLLASVEVEGKTGWCCVELN